MSARPIPVLAALAAALVVCAGHRLVLLRRALDAERAARRLADGLHQQDLAAFTMRINAALQAREALAQADLVLDSALAVQDPEGGHP